VIAGRIVTQSANALRGNSDGAILILLFFFLSFDRAEALPG
jgi:hypothetical protein